MWRAKSPTTPGRLGDGVLEACRLAAGWLPVTLRRAKAAPFGADHASEMLVAEILVACSEDAERTLVNLTVIRASRPAATVTVRWPAPW